MFSYVPSQTFNISYVPSQTFNPECSRGFYAPRVLGLGPHPGFFCGDNERTAIGKRLVTTSALCRRPVGTPRGSGTQMKQATLPLDEGMMMFQWSSPLSDSSKALAGVWIDSIVKKLIDATEDQEPSDSSPQQDGAVFP